MSNKEGETVNPDPMEKIRQNIRELQERRELGEFTRKPLREREIFDINEPGRENRPITKNDLLEGGNRALVLHINQFKELGFITIVRANGEIDDIFAEDFCQDNKAVLIFFPEELGN